MYTGCKPAARFYVQNSMKIERHKPCDALKPFVKTYITIESDHGMQNNVLPDTAVIMAFRYKGRVLHTLDNGTSLLPTSMVTGLRNTPRALQYEKNTATLLAVLHEGAAPAFFNLPLNELFGQSLSLDTLLPAPTLRDVEDQLAEAPHTPARIAIVEKFLRARLRETAPDPIIRNAISHIKLAHGNVRIKALVEAFPLSRDPFEKRFRRTTGTSPKQFSALIRLRHLIDSYAPETGLANLALDAGYYDQAHFTKDFTLFTGKSPKAFFNAGPWW